MISEKGHDVSCPYQRLKSGCLKIYGAGDYAATVGAGYIDGLRIHDVGSEDERGRRISSELQRKSIAHAAASGPGAADGQTIAGNHDICKYALVRTERTEVNRAADVIRSRVRQCDLSDVV